MNRLYIISDTEFNASRFGSNFGLNSGLFKAVTSLADAENVPDGAIIINDDNHPLDAVAINTRLNIKNCLNLKDKETLNKFMDALVEAIDYVNNMYGNGDDAQVRFGARKLKEIFDEMKLNVLNGFDFMYMYNLNGRYFYVVPQNEKSKVIVNLIKWKIYDNRNKNKTFDTGIITYDPRGILKKKSIDYSWMH